MFRIHPKSFKEGDSLVAVWVYDGTKWAEHVKYIDEDFYTWNDLDEVWKYSDTAYICMGAHFYLLERTYED